MKDTNMVRKPSNRTVKNRTGKKEKKILLF